MDTNDRRDLEISRAWAQNIALEVAVTAILRSHPNRAALAAAWKDAEDLGFTWTSDAPEFGPTRGTSFWSSQAALPTGSAVFAGSA